MKKWFLVIVLITCCLGTETSQAENFYMAGAFYQDWMGFKYGDSDFYNRLSSRLKLTLINRAGEGWTGFIDFRNRYTMGEAGKDQFIVYDARISYDSVKSKLFFSIGQMNLYDTAGIGQLTGGMVGWKLNKYLSVGGYGGIEPDIYNSRWDLNYQKYGAFIRYLGHGAKQLSLSYNYLSFEGNTERQYLYTAVMLPVKGILVFYGNMEYELGSGIKNEDKLSRLFFNTRVNLSRFVDVTANYSSGRGLDYHRFLLEQSQDPTLQYNEIERYYYSETYGVRLSVKPLKGFRFYVARRQSEQKDKGIKNHSNQFGFSAVDLFKSGVSLYGNYTMNRGDASESDSYYISASRNFGKLSWSLSFSNYYNGIRFIDGEAPEILHLPDQKTISTNFFFILNKALAFSAEYAYSNQPDTSDHQFFIRVIYRKR